MNNLFFSKIELVSCMINKYNNTKQTYVESNFCIIMEVLNYTRNKSLLTEKNESSYSCMTCSKTFHTASALFQHTHFIHSNHRSYACGFCGKETESTKELHDHIHVCQEYAKVAHLQEAPCDISCDSSVTDVSEVCERRCDEKVFICDCCGHSFKQKGNMDKHRLKKHGIPLPSTRQTRHKLRKKIVELRYVWIETERTKCSRYVIRDTYEDHILTDDEDNIIYLAKSVAKKYADNCNIIYGLQLAFQNNNDPLPDKYSNARS